MTAQYYVTVPRNEFNERFGFERSAVIYSSKAYAILHEDIAKTMRLKKQSKFNVVAEFHSSTDKNYISHTKSTNGWVLLKNRNIHYFDYKFAPHEAWIDLHHVKERLYRKGLHDEEWVSRFPRLLFRDIARNDDERTLISCLVAPGAVSSYDTPMFLPECEKSLYPKWIAFYAAAFSAFLFDFMIRPFVDKHIKGYTLARVCWPSPESISGNCLGLKWFTNRILELVYTTHDFYFFAQDCGWKGPPFQRNEERSFLLRCELDAAFFLFYLGSQPQWQQKPEDIIKIFPTPRHAIDYIMETFVIVKRKDEAKFNGDYRTKRVILEIYDSLLESIKTGKPYQTRLDPPPADVRLAHIDELNRSEDISSQEIIPMQRSKEV